MLSLIGVAIVIIGFILRVDTLAVVVIAGITTGLVSGLNLNEIMQTLGTSFVNSRNMTLFIITLPVIGLMERYGLRERAGWAIAQIKGAKANGILSLYLIARIVMAALSMRLSGHVQFVRPLVVPMAEGAVDANYKDVPESEYETVKALSAASENYGNFFGQNLFIGASGVMLVVSTLQEIGFNFSDTEGSLTVVRTTLPIAVILGVVGLAQFYLNERKIKASQGGRK